MLFIFMMTPVDIRVMSEIQAPPILKLEQSPLTPLTSPISMNTTQVTATNLVTNNGGNSMMPTVIQEGEPESGDVDNGFAIKNCAFGVTHKA